MFAFLFSIILCPIGWSNLMFWCLITLVRGSGRLRENGRGLGGKGEVILGPQIPQIEVIKKGFVFLFCVQFFWNSLPTLTMNVLVMCGLFFYFSIVCLLAPPPSKGGQQEAYIFSRGFVRYKPSFAITCHKFAFLEMALCLVNLKSSSLDNKLSLPTHPSCPLRLENQMGLLSIPQPLDGSRPGAKQVLHIKWWGGL